MDTFGSSAPRWLDRVEELIKRVGSQRQLSNPNEFYVFDRRRPLYGRRGNLGIQDTSAAGFNLRIVFPLPKLPRFGVGLRKESRHCFSRCEPVVRQDRSGPFEDRG